MRVCVHSARGWGFFSFFFLSMHMHECMFISKCADDRPFTHKSESLKILQMVMTLNATIQQFKTIIKKKNFQQCDVKFSFTIFILTVGLISHRGRATDY